LSESGFTGLPGKTESKGVSDNFCPKRQTENGKLKTMLNFHLRKHLDTAEGRQWLDVALRVQPGTLLAVYGPSGVGKTTLLRMLAGLTAPDEGRIWFDDHCWYDSAKRVNLPPQQRHVGVVFQEAALFPNMTVRQQLVFALPDRKQPQPVDELLELCGLTALADRLPARLSGGQRQRAALARALARQPRLLLLDEPFSSLDDVARWQLQDETRRLHRYFGLTTMLVSHSADEVTRMADEVVMLEAGRIKRQGSPTDVFSFNV
jgi:molybdate transport system ATP-binding protein